MKETFYFRHDYNARNDERILELRSRFGYEGYGVYWALVESLAESSDGYLSRGAIGGLSVGLGLDKKLLESVLVFCVEIGLFYEEKGRFFSSRIVAHKQERKLFSESGKKGALAKWANRSQPDGGATTRANGPLDGKERKGEERRSTGLDQKILTELGRYESVGNPEAYLRSLTAKAGEEAVAKAWSEWRRGNGIESPADFYARCLHWKKALRRDAGSG